MVMRLRICSKRSKFEHLLKTRPQAEVLHRSRSVTSAHEDLFMALDKSMKTHYRFGAFVFALLITFVILAISAGCRDEYPLTPAEELAKKVAQPRSHEFQALLCVATSDALVHDAIELPIPVYGRVTIQWSDEKEKRKAVFTAVTKAQKYCTLLISESEYAAPIKRVQLDLTKEEFGITRVEYCAWTSASTPVTDVHGRQHAPCVEIKPYAGRLYGISMVLTENELFDNFTPVLVGRRTADSPTLIP
ncbi:MAG: hypothetical protein AAB384_04205 [Patescibacteria group bacterium]